jgi:hypothetical protein
VKICTRCRDRIAVPNRSYCQKCINWLEKAPQT